VQTAMSHNLAAVVLAGGSGTRFWPLSTADRPKQFLKLSGQRSMIQMSVDRLRAFLPAERILILSNEQYAGLLREQLPEIPASNIILEPCARDTAAACALAALVCEARFGSCVIATVTADHHIDTQEEFQTAILSAIDGISAEPTALYTLGITPYYPAISYGYLKCGVELDSHRHVKHFQLTAFREKPDRELATNYFESRDYLWNSGMFVWRSTAILDAFALHSPDHVEKLKPVLQYCASGSDVDGKDAEHERFATAFASLEKISIDYAIMEKVKNIRCVVPKFTWNDVGGWLSLESFLTKTDGNWSNVSFHTLDGNNNIVFSEDEGEDIAILGVSDIVAVRSANRTLIMHREYAEKLKQVVSNIAKPQTVK